MSLSSLEGELLIGDVYEAREGGGVDLLFFLRYWIRMNVFLFKQFLFASVLFVLWNKER